MAPGGISFIYERKGQSRAGGAPLAAAHRLCGAGRDRVEARRRRAVPGQIVCPEGSRRRGRVAAPRPAGRAALVREIERHAAGRSARGGRPGGAETRPPRSAHAAGGAHPGRAEGVSRGDAPATGGGARSAEETEPERSPSARGAPGEARDAPRIAFPASNSSCLYRLSTYDSVYVVHICIVTPRHHTHTRRPSHDHAL